MLILHAGLAKELDLSVWLPSKQRGLVSAAASGGCPLCEALLKRCVARPTDSSGPLLQITDMGKLNVDLLQQAHPTAERIIAWRPTGWTFSQRSQASGPVKVKPRPGVPVNVASMLGQLSDCVSVVRANASVTIFGEFNHLLTVPDLNQYCWP